MPGVGGGLVRDQAQRLRELTLVRRIPEPAFLPDAGRVIAVTSGKGGVGKTSIVANLGTLLARRGLKVTLLDADFGLANIDILLNLSPAKNLGHLLRGEAAPSDVLVSAGQGLKVIPGASGIAALADLERPEREALLSSLAPLTAGADLVFVDTSAGIGRNVVELCAASTEVLLVTNPEPTSITDAYGLIKVLVGKRPNCTVRLLVNSVSGAREARSVFFKLDQVASRFLDRRISYVGPIERDDCFGR
ncbi:MAG: MinD/ParA family protein, partial [Deltaproteobacteria bacterium]|nr:MinD/ParA family protein [Deltaproteobacteria bacterium]